MGDGDDEVGEIRAWGSCSQIHTIPRYNRNPEG